jgi:hypothetical protein
MAEKDRKPGQNGKGDKPCPRSVPRKKFFDNWDRTFNNKKKK